MLPGDKQQSMETAQLQYGQASKLHKCLARTVLPQTHEDVQQQRAAKRNTTICKAQNFDTYPIAKRPGLDLAKLEEDVGCALEVAAADGSQCLGASGQSPSRNAN